MKKILTLALPLLFVFQAQAEVWHVSSEITKLYPTSGSYVFNLAIPLPTLSNCDSGTRFEIHASNPKYDALVSSLLMAFAMQKPIRINISDENKVTCSPIINRFIISR